MTFMIYGAAGYTGRLATQHALSIGLKPIVAGRSESTRNFAKSVDLGSRIFSLTDNFDQNLQGISVILNCAGPFSLTAKPLIDACIRNGIHYLDVCAELDSYRIGSERDAEAKAASSMLLPGSGGSVAMLGCLAAFALTKASDPTKIDIALHVSGPMSRGSITTVTEGGVAECLHRKDGQMVTRDANTISFDFKDGRGEVDSFPITLPDLITLGRSTGSGDIGTFVNVSSSDGFPSADPATLPDGPSAEEREANPYHAAVSVTNKDGSVTKAVLHSANGYTFTAVASVEAAKRVLEGQVKPGFQTPVEVFGKEFVEAVDGSKLMYA